MFISNYQQREIYVKKKMKQLRVIKRLCRFETSELNLLSVISLMYVKF